MLRTTSAEWTPPARASAQAASTAARPVGQHRGKDFDQLGSPSSEPFSQRCDMREEWCALDHRICAFNNEFAARAREDERARRLATIPGRSSNRA